MDIATLGVIPVAVLGAVVGSFLNVVIYRLPRGLSVLRPLWSFCPECHVRIHPASNVPIFGWLVLGGRCRACRAPISMIYPVIEAANALVFVMIWDAIVVATAVPGGRIAEGTMVIAAFILFSGLLAISGMDIESYTIHIQIPLLVVAAGVVLHAIRGLPAAPPRGEAPLLPPAVCASALLMGAVWLITALVRRRMDAGRMEVESDVPASGASQSDIAESSGAVPSMGPHLEVVAHEAPQLPSRFHPVPIMLLAGVVVLLAAWQALAPMGGLESRIPPQGQRAMLATGVLFLMLVLASLIHREADHQIVEDLERERPRARAMIMGEFAGLAPAALLGVLMIVWLRYSGRVNASWPDVLVTAAARLPLTSHLAGGCHALASAILAAALGWAVRILGTLAFGKEAFGSGDIYILAAIGAVGGLWVTMIAFLLASILALMGVLATSFRKTSRAIPFGPWLALGAFASLWLTRPIIEQFGPAFGWLFWMVISGSPARFQGY